jgi:hypothetical protein
LIWSVLKNNTGSEPNFHLKVLRSKKEEVKPFSVAFSVFPDSIKIVEMKFSVEEDPTVPSSQIL